MIWLLEDSEKKFLTWRKNLESRSLKVNLARTLSLSLLKSRDEKKMAMFVMQRNWWKFHSLFSGLSMQQQTGAVKTT